MKIKIGKESREFLGVYSLLWIFGIIALIFKRYDIVATMGIFIAFNSLYVISWIRNGWLKD